MERDVSAASCEFHALVLAIARLAHKDTEHIDESRIIKDGAQLRHESCILGRGQIDLVSVIALCPFADRDAGGDEAVDEGLDGGADDDVEFDGDGDGADAYEALVIADGEVGMQHLDSEVLVDVVAEEEGGEGGVDGESGIFGFEGFIGIEELGEGVVVGGGVGEDGAGGHVGGWGLLFWDVEGAGLWI